MRDGKKVMFSLRRRDESQYRVMLLNDDATSMEFVVYVLETFFDMTDRAARELMLQVHNNGIAECGVYSKKTATPIKAQGDGLCSQISASSAMRDGKK